MALTTLAGLRTAVTARMARTGDAAFTAEFPDFVTLAEQRMMMGGEEPFKSSALRLQAMEANADITITDGVGALPAGMLEARRLYWSANPNLNIVYLPPETFWPRYQSTAAGVAPIYYTIEGTNLYTSPMVGGTCKLLYYAALTPLVVDGDTNWLLTNAPAAYLYGVMIEAHLRYRNDEQAQAAFAIYKSTVDALTRQQTRERFTGQMAPRVAFT